MHTVIHFVDSRVFGGAEKIVLTLIAGLDRNRWRPVLVHHPEPGLLPLLEDARRLGVELHSVPRGRGVTSLSRILQLSRVVRAAQPSIFHAHLFWPLGSRRGLIAAALARVPAVVATAHSFNQAERRSGSITRRLPFMPVDRFLAVSDWVASGLRDVSGIPAEKIRVVRNGIPSVFFDCPFDERLRATLSGRSERPLVLTSARLHEPKGHKYLLEAAATIPEAVFLLAGDGPQRAELEALARALQLDDRVVFLGHREDIPDLLAICDLFVLPSLFEGHPVSVMEAAAARKPIIATAVGGTDEAVSHGETGLLVPPADSTALARAIRTLLEEPALANRLANAAYARAQKEFSADAMCERTMAAYEELMASHAGKGTEDRSMQAIT